MILLENRFAVEVGAVLPNAGAGLDAKDEVPPPNNVEGLLIVVLVGAPKVPKGATEVA